MLNIPGKKYSRDHILGYDMSPNDWTKSSLKHTQELSTIYTFISIYLLLFFALHSIWLTPLLFFL